MLLLLSHRKGIAILALIFLLFGATSLWAQSSPSELLLPVDERVIERLSRSTNYGLRAQLYSAKRYRFVEINFAALEQPEGSSIRVTPFEDRAVTLVKQQTPTGANIEQSVPWVGEVVSTRTNLQFIDPTGRSVPPPRMFANFWIRTGLHEVSLSLAKEIATENGESIQFGGLPDISDLPIADSRQAFTKIPLRTVRGSWSEIGKSGAIVLEPVQDDPRYHVVYEEDPDKIPFGGHEYNEERTRRLEQQREFMEELERERVQEAESRRERQ